MLNKLSIKIGILILLVGLLPLFLFGRYSIHKTIQVTRQMQLMAHQRLSTELTERIRNHLNNTQSILLSLVENFNNVIFDPDDRNRILRNVKLSSDEFERFYILNLDKSVAATSEVDANPAQNSQLYALFDSVVQGPGIKLSDLYLSTSGVPTLMMAVPVVSFGKTTGVLIAEIGFVELWKAVGSVTFGRTGHATLYSDDGRILATGDGRKKRMAIILAQDPNHDRYRTIKDEGVDFKLMDGRHVLAAAHLIESPYNWLVVIEQDASEAFGLARALERSLYLLAVIVLMMVVVVGYFISKREIVSPFNAIMKRIHEIAKGRIAGKTEVSISGEFGELAKTLDLMSEQLIDYQNRLVIEEKISVMGRVASHLAHDIKHPVQNIDNYFRVFLSRQNDPDYVSLFATTVKRELGKINSFLENFRDLSKDMPFKPMRNRMSLVIDQIVGALGVECQSKQIEIETHCYADPEINMDLMLVNRLLTNICRNAIEAMPDGGRLVFHTRISREHESFPGGALCVEIQDTGKGIPDEVFGQLFRDFMSTKSTGIGLGLVISQRIIQKHGGDLRVMSRKDEGTRFEMFFPLPA